MKFPSLKVRLRQALLEDQAFADVTSRQLPGFKNQRVQAKVISKERGIFCGGFLIKPLFRLLDPAVRVRILKSDGSRLRRGEVVATLRGKTGAILGGERVFLNLACHLSGIATLTRAYVDAVRATPAFILDTRKTAPLWRDLEKYAVRCGGGFNHRLSLEDAVLVKDNHLRFLRSRNISPAEVFERSRFKEKLKFVEMEAETYRDVWEAIKAKADIILLDNMPLNRLKGSLVFIKAARAALSLPTPLVEVSGGVTLKKARLYARLGVDRISVGALTHSAPALDLSLEVD